MAMGCRAKSGADFALSTTGIAGPAGGTPNKPVGLVYIGLADAHGCRVEELIREDLGRLGVTETKAQANARGVE